MSSAERGRLIGNIVAGMKTVPENIQKHPIQHFLKANPLYGAGVADGLGWEIKDIVPIPRVMASLLTRSHRQVLVIRKRTPARVA